MVSNRNAPLIPGVEPPDGLLTAILTRIELARQRVARLRLVAFGTITFVSLVMLIPAVQYAMSEFYASGFYEYVSLFFNSLSQGYWREILYSLTDSLPSLALLILAVISITFVWSLQQVNRNVRIVFTRLAL